MDLSNSDWDCPRFSPEEISRREKEWDDFKREIAFQNWMSYLRKESEIQKTAAKDLLNVLNTETR